MNTLDNIACVTGATGMVGLQIVKQLLIRGYRVRILTRQASYDNSNVEIYVGSLEDEEILKMFLKDAHLLFHCAAELHDEAKMWEVNVNGTERLLNLVAVSDIKYFCYLSSVGVTGRTQLKLVNETTACNPQNVYERSKWAAEQLVARPIIGCKIVILRPTNVIDEQHPGALLLPINNSWIDRLKVFIKGGECSHIIHAEDVAAASLYLISYPCNSPQCFIVSNDNEPYNTFAGLWALYRSLVTGRKEVQLIPHLPILIPYLLRLIWRGIGNRGDVIYSSEKLLSTGFVFHIGLVGAVQQMVFSKEAHYH